MNNIDAYLNTVTMYRLVLYGLIAIAVSALGLSAAGMLHYPVLELAGSLGVLLASGYMFHYVLRKAFRADTGVESWLITVLILFLILKPTDDLPGYAVLTLGAALAMASKYVLALGNRHLFNPAAIALLILGLLGSGEVYWWVGSDVLLPVVFLVGLLVVRKVRRFAMVGVFALAALVAFSISSGIGLQPSELLRNAILSGPLVFFAVIMLTEPATMPPQKHLHLAYGALVGLLYGMQFSLGPLHSSPELALVAGNLFAYAVSSKRRYLLTLVGQSHQGGGVYEYIFQPDHPVRFYPGQYMEWTLPHHRPDSRGNRRYFTIASAPEEPEIRLGVRIDPEHASSFKRALLALQPGDKLWAAQLSGDFILPRDSSRKLVWIAGGVGITPFRSMVQHLISTNQQRDITLFYSSLTADGFAYWQLFNQAVPNGVKPYYLITGKEVPPDWTGLTGFLNPRIVQEQVPGYKDALYYLSGPNAMVASYKQMLLSAGVPSGQIKTDYFPGF